MGNSNLLTSIKQYGLRNMLYSFDTISSLLVLLILIYLYKIQIVNISDSVMNCLTELCITIALAMLALCITAYSIIANLVSDAFLNYLVQKDKFQIVAFPFRWNSLVWFFSLVSGILIYLFGINGYTWIPINILYISYFVYCLFCFISIIQSINLFMEFRAKFALKQVD